MPTVTEEHNEGAENDDSMFESEKKERERIERRKNIYMNNKNATEILGSYDKIMRTIEKVQKTTA